jgi:hypothetical protein
MNKGMKISMAIIAGVIVVAVVAMVGLSVVQASGGSFFTNMAQIMGWRNQSTHPIGPMMGGNYFSGTPSSSQTNPFGPVSDVTPLTMDQARQAAASYFNQLNDPDLEIAEIMVFTNNAYIRVIEKDSGIGAMELLVDPTTLAVIPEYGPNMMWNLKYSPMYGASYGDYGSMKSGYGGMMRGYYQGSLSTTMTVSSQQAVSIAQQYLDTHYPGYQTDPDPDQFYGYYTVDILQDGNPAGMLSVNGYSGQVFLHTWHGNFITSWEG